jgi:hypothetical protein
VSAAFGARTCIRSQESWKPWKRAADEARTLIDAIDTPLTPACAIGTDRFDGLHLHSAGAVIKMQYDDAHIFSVMHLGAAGERR